MELVSIVLDDIDLRLVKGVNMTERDVEAVEIDATLQRHATGVDPCTNLDILYKRAYEAGRKSVIDKVKHAIEPYPGEGCR